MPESIEIAVLSASWGEIFKMLSSNAGESFSVLHVVETAWKCGNKFSRCYRSTTKADCCWSVTRLTKSAEVTV
ncbi:hypothetical protein JG687_00008002 [Phytophthora cactorum]|uniref:Uncharacterized protein n=1 Tax=Phytophthora cactorum TaxID=29920 RepID=A0A8T1UDJ5_9STRA|nr:hypothetical protein GQ600_11445 [Phytophthora cactorum]KAG6960848.1 hypothetical protein JG687_00008002 [Phytophthora cactorum]